MWKHILLRIQGLLYGRYGPWGLHFYLNNLIHLNKFPYVTQVMIKFKNTMINHLLTLFLIFNKASKEI